MECSIVIPTRNKVASLKIVLESIYSQEVPFPFEVIVVDDSADCEASELCEQFGVNYLYTGNTRYRNPAAARNIGYREAKGRVVLCQCDDIVHITPDAIERLVTGLRKGEFLLAETKNYHYVNGKPNRYIRDYCSAAWPKPYFFLGAISREDLYAIGGNDEEFVEPCYDDNWFADCLMYGLGLTPRITNAVQAHHISHAHSSDSHAKEFLSKELYAKKKSNAERTGEWVSSGGPWSL